MGQMIELLSDEEVVVRVRTGELALFEVLMRRHNQRLFRIARAVLRNDADAEDAVQQTYVSAYAHLAQFAGDAKFATWLTLIAINEALGRRRKQLHHAETELDSEEASMSAPTVTPEDSASRRELTGLLEAAIDGLPDIYRMVVVLRDVQQLSIAEAAACLDLTEETVKIRTHRAKGMLRRALATQLDALAPESFAFLGTRCDRMVADVMRRLHDKT